MIPKPWSHSALQAYMNCPKAYYETRVAKSVVELPNAGGTWGNYVHEEFEKYLNSYKARTHYDSDLYALPTDLVQYLPYLDAITALPGTMHVECKYAINAQQQPCDYFAPDVWCRVIIDVLHVDGQRAHIIDHKTGKRKLDTRQLMLSALVVFAHHPQVKVTKTGFCWLKDQKADYETYVRAEIGGLWEEFIPDLTRYMRSAQTMTFGPRPSGLCNGWCPVTKCEFWKPKRK